MDLEVQGMYGMGDNLHQRAIVRQLVRSSRVQLQTPWPQIYHDLVGARLRLVPATTSLRTQRRNIEGQRAAFEQRQRCRRRLRIWYTGDGVRRDGTILGAMLRSAGVSRSQTDFRLAVPDAWCRDLGIRTHKPLLFYRPLVDRKEWKGCMHRNPDHEAYSALISHIRERFFVVSVADLVPGVEWESGVPLQADAVFHRGELRFEDLCAIMRKSTVAFCSPGFALVLAQAVETPVICVFGGREDSSVYADGAALTPTLGIDTIRPCRCFDHSHRCERRIDVPRAIGAIDEFLADL